MADESMVERLAKKRHRVGENKTNSIYRREARWWLNAIADEMDKVNTMVPSTAWLRAQASTGESE